MLLLSSPPQKRHFLPYTYTQHPQRWGALAARGSKYGKAKIVKARADASSFFKKKEERPASALPSPSSAVKPTTIHTQREAQWAGARVPNYGKVKIVKARADASSFFKKKGRESATATRRVSNYGRTKFVKARADAPSFFKKQRSPGARVANYGNVKKKRTSES